MLASRFGLVALLGVTMAAPVVAQDSTTCISCSSRDHGPSDFALRSSGNIAFFQGRPVGALENNIGFGYGVTGGYQFRLDQRGIFSLRADVGISQYGDEWKRVPLSPTIGGRIQVKVRTNNYLVPMSIGPQLTWPSGIIRPYVNAGIGAQGFYTQSSVDDDDGNETSSQFSTTNQSDWTATWVAGGGVYIPVYQGRTKVLLDLGVQYLATGHASYLRPGSIVDLPNSQIQINPLESDTHMLLVRLGVKIGL
ncbi:MAG TPA: outer membrane beta-barrel protein [Gemmatimonadaceae bacterium]|nr:outer membrane beta-barrel protein [Gemmatimonadaceae bacterium]